jgi:hypothetical protein
MWNRNQTQWNMNQTPRNRNQTPAANPAQNGAPGNQIAYGAGASLMHMPRQGASRYRRFAPQQSDPVSEDDGNDGQYVEDDGKMLGAVAALGVLSITPWFFVIPWADFIP